MAEAAPVERQDRIPRLYCLGDPGAEPVGSEVRPIYVGISAMLMACRTGDDVSPEIGELIFERLTFELPAWHTRDVSRALGQCAGMTLEVDAESGR